MSRLPPVRGVRARLLLVVVTALAVALGAAIIGFNVLLARDASRDADTLLQSRASAELGTIRVAGNRISLAANGSDALGDSRVWVFRGLQVIEEPRARASTAVAARALANGPRRFFNVPDSEERLLAVPIRQGQRRVGTLVTGISLEPYHHTQRTALIFSLTLFALVAACATIAAWWMLRAALRPVGQMTAQAETWSEEDLERRFAVGEPYDELTRLAATLDRLLARLAASLRHERQFSAAMSHELRTPLAKLMAEAELALRRTRSESEYRESLEAVLGNAEQIERIVETLLSTARQEFPRGVANAREIAEAVVAAYSDDALSRGVELDLELSDSSERMRVGVDQDIAERILYPVVENALRYSRNSVRVQVARNGSAVLFAVDDDGPGVTTDEHEAIFEPAVRGSAGRSTNNGAGLGLALSRRLARAVSGDVEVHPGASGHFVVRLPAA